MQQMWPTYPSIHTSFLGSALNLLFHLQCLRLSSCALGFSCHLFLPNLFFNLCCSPWYHNQRWNTALCALIYCNRASWVEFCLYRIPNLHIDKEHRCVNINSICIGPIHHPSHWPLTFVSTFLGHLKLSPNSWGSTLCVDLVIPHQCYWFPISVELLASRMCTRSGNILLLVLFCLTHFPNDT